jgi:hypothetical protein
MGFKSFVGSWFGSFIAASVWATIVAFFFKDAINLQLILLNGFFASLLFTSLSWAAHLPFKTPTLLTSVIGGWVFTLGFTLLQHTFVFALPMLAMMAGFGAILGGGAYFGMRFLSGNSNPTN